MAGPYTVTATLNTVGNAALQGNAFVRFRLRNFSGFVPRVSGTAVIAETQIDAFPDASGLVSQLLWGNSDITPNTTFYTVEWWDSGRIVSSGNYTINGATNLNTAAQNNAPPVPPGFSLTLQNNGANNSSQTLLNLVNTDGSVVITDISNGAIQLNAKSTGFSTAGQGYFFGPGLDMDPHSFASNVVLNTTIITTNNEVRAYQFTLKTSWTIRKVTSQLGGGSFAGRTFTFGIYDALKNKVLDSGAFDGSLTTVQTLSITPVVLAPGTYYFAQSTNNTGVLVMGIGGNAGSLVALTGLFNTAAVRTSIAANPAVAGVLPATLGTLTAEGASPAGVAIPLFEP